ncbi:MAG: alpha/beta hydrolase [Actinobacteria bacterium]|nr:alpha/beta hydrolase [Actinomycetota bacterium]
MAESEVERVEIPAGEFVFDALASGPPGGSLVLLLHGFPQSSYQWRHQLPALARAGYRAVAPDQRGYSSRARPEAVDAYHVDRLVADVLAMADGLGGHQVHLVGHDWGAMVAWAVAGRCPQRLRSLTAVSTPHPLALAQALAAPSGDQASRSRYVRFFQQARLPEWVLLAAGGAGLRMLFAKTGYTDETGIREYGAVLGEPGALTAALNWYRALDLASLGGVGPVNVPTLYVWSSDDPALGREAADGTASYVDGPYRFEVLDGVSHWIPEEAPELLGRLLIDHFKNAEAGPASASALPPADQ